MDAANPDTQVLVTISSRLVGLGPDREDEVADRIRALGCSSPAHRPIRLQDILDVVPWIREADVALDAAIQVDLAGRDGLGAEEAAEELVAEHPELRRQIQRAAILSALMGSSGTGFACDRTQTRMLPCDYGAPDLDGNPRYELRSVLGTGSQGTVYLAVDRLFSERHAPCMVALKIGHRTLGVDQQRADAREAIRARRVSHPGVVRVIEHGVDDTGRAFSVFELVEGVPLDTWLRNRSGETDAREATQIVSSLCVALQAAHSAGIVHRDIKPSNILIDRAGVVRITDFGVARDSGIPLDSSRAYSSRGSLGFMAPEQYRGDPEADAPYADVYSLGGILFWLLTQRFPNGDSASEAIARLEADATYPRDIRPYRSNVPSALVRVIERSLSPDVTRRYGSAEAFGHDLRAWLANKPIEWQRPSMAERSVKFVRRKPIPVAAGAFAALACIALVYGIVDGRADARLHEARAIAAEREGVLQAQLATLEERQAAQAQRERDARERIKSWMGVLQATRLVEPGEYLAVIGSLSRLELFQENSVAESLANNRIGIARDVLASLEVEGHADSLESAIWNGLLGTWLLREGEQQESAMYLRRAESRMSEILDDSDPWLQEIRSALGQAQAVDREG